MIRLVFVMLFAAMANAPVLSDDTPRIMQMAIATGNLTLLEECIEAGVPVDGFSEPPTSGNKRLWGSLALAVAWNQPRVVKWLLAHEANPRAQIEPGRTAYDLAVEAQSKELQAMLCPQNASKDQTAAENGHAPLMASAPARPALKNKHAFLCADVETLPWKLTPAVLSLMVKHGLDPVGKTSSTALSSNVFLEIAFIDEPDLLHVLLDARSDWDKHRNLWRCAVEEAHRLGHTDITRMLKVQQDERLTDRLHTSAIEVLLEMSAHDRRFQHTFVNFNDADPSEAVMRVIRGQLPNACNHSLCREQPDKIPSYTHQRTSKPGNMVQLRLVKTEKGYDFYVRNSTGPVMAGSGCRGTLVLCQGHWVIDAAQGWEE